MQICGVKTLLSRWLILCFALLMRTPAVRAAEKAAPGNVNVLLWFDTEDYLLPADDDASKRLATMLSDRGIRATFKIVGEKARVLEKRGRTDVIAALKKHDIGYHANLHSVHPTPSEYLANCGWLDGVAEFARREGGGAADVRRIFGVDTLVCYGQPGASWAPQAYGALAGIGIAPGGVPCYVDEDSHIKLNGEPFWYSGGLTVFNMSPNFARMELHDPAAVEPATKKFAAIADRLRSGGGGLISIYYHPCEWVHQEFWDGFNFRHGANPPREDWKPPGQLPPAETDAAFERFGQYINYIQATPGVRFISATNLPPLYPDRLRSTGATAADVETICARVQRPNIAGFDYLEWDGKSFSVADQFELATTAVRDLITDGSIHFPIRTAVLAGPDNPPPTGSTNSQVAWRAFRDSALDVYSYLQTHHRIPARVFIGADEVAPVDFLPALAFTLSYHREHGSLPLHEPIPLGSHLTMLTERFVAKDTPAVFGNWVIHRQGFRAPKILEMARLQAWTMKPAVRAE